MILYTLLCLACCLGEEYIYNYLGTWEGDIMNFDEQVGRCYFIIYDRSDSGMFYELLLFDGEWESRPSIMIEGNFSGFTTSYLSLDSVKITTPDITYRNCDIEGQLVQSSTLSGLLFSIDCEITLILDLQEYTLVLFYIGKLIYLGIFILLKIVEFLTLRRIQYYCNSSNVAHSIAPLSFILSSALDVFYCLWWLYLVSSGYVTRMQISYLLLILIVFVPIMMIREKQKLYNKAIEFQSAVPRRNRFFTFMIVAMIYFIVLRSLYYFNVVASNLAMVPQIIKNLNINSIPRGLVAMLIIVQLMLTLYFTLFPYNFLIWEPDIILSFTVILVCIIQLALLLWRKPRVRSDIEEPILRRNEINPETLARIIERGRECGICLEGLNGIDMVATRCQHAYHCACLQRWIAIHPICPVCREDIQDLIVN